MYNYSNPNFYVAGLVPELLSGSYYRTYMHDNVWTPLGMNRTFLLPAEVIADGDYAVGTSAYEPYNRGPVGPDTYDNGWARPCGYAFSSVLDLAEFVKFLRNGNPLVLSDALLADMQSPQLCTEELLDLVHYGFGLFVSEGFWIGEDFYDLRVVRHDGYLPGFCSKLYWFPALDFGIVTLATGDSGYFDDVIRQALLTLTPLPAPAPAPDISVDPASFPDFVGTYYSTYYTGYVYVTRESDGLHLTIPFWDTNGYPYQPLLRAVSPDNFYFDMLGTTAQLTFIRDQNDQVEYLRTRHFVAARLDRTRAGETLPAPIPDLERLRRQVRLAPPIDWTLQPPGHQVGR